MRRVAWMFVIALVALGTGCGKSWEKYSSEKFGFSMLVPKDTKLVSKDYGGGWGGLSADVNGVEIYGAARLGVQAELAEIQAFGTIASGVPLSAWTKESDGKDANGWTWWHTYRASAGDKLLYAVLGTGAKGSYLLFLRTTSSDFEAHKDDYQKWYSNIALL